MSKPRQLKSMKLRMSLLLFVLTALSGCLTASPTYWAPDAKGGRLFYNGDSSIAPGNTVEFLFNGVRVFFSGDGTWVGMGLFVPEGRVVSFLSNSAELHSPALTKIKFDVTSIDAISIKRLHFSPTGSLTSEFYSADIQFRVPERAQYRLKMPAIKINDQIYEIPEIEFIKKQ